MQVLVAAISTHTKREANALHFLKCFDVQELETADARFRSIQQKARIFYAHTPKNFKGSFRHISNILLA